VAGELLPARAPGDQLFLEQFGSAPVDLDPLGERVDDAHLDLIPTAVLKPHFLAVNFHNPGLSFVTGGLSGQGLVGGSSLLLVFPGSGLWPDGLSHLPNGFMAGLQLVAFLNPNSEIRSHCFEPNQLD